MDTGGNPAPTGITKAIFILSSVCSSLEFWSANHASIYENSESQVFKNIKLGWNI